MKSIILSLCTLASITLLQAQEQDSIQQLNNVEVTASQVIAKPDGLLIFPTHQQKESSSNGYSLLQKLSLPNIRVNEASRSIASLDKRGGVQLRINGIVAGKQEMLELNPKLISKIEFIDNPGVRYGEEIACVIQIITRREDCGYTLGTDLTTMLTAVSGNGMVYGKWNRGNSELSVSYDYSGNRLKGERTTQVADYTLNDGSLYTIERKDFASLQKNQSHDLKLTYSLADSNTYVFQVALSENINHSPRDYTSTLIDDGLPPYVAHQRNSTLSKSPVLDLYYFRQLSPRQSITANAVSTYISSQNSHSYDEGEHYQYDVEGKTLSALSEVIYENRLKAFTFSSGINYRYKNTQNDYTGDASALTEMNQNSLYGFGEIKGSLKQFRYSLGVGASYIHYRQNKHSYDFGTFRPKANLTYNPTQEIQLSYIFQQCDRASRIAMINEATIQTNSMEYTQGNPKLKPARDTEHTLRMSYNNYRLSTSIGAYFKRCDKPNMAQYERTSEDKFIYTQINQKEIDLLHNSAYLSYWIMPETLQVYLYGGMQRCFNYGNDYKHFYTSWFCVANLAAYIGDFSLQAYFDNGSRFLEGETKGFNGAYSVLQGSYGYKDWNITLSWYNPFVQHYKSSEGEILNRNLHKHTTVYQNDSGNSVYLSASWRLSRGRREREIQKRIQLQDKETGILMAK